MAVTLTNFHLPPNCWSCRGPIKSQDFLGGANGKESTCQGRRCKKGGFNPWVGKISWSRNWHSTPVFLPGKFHGQRSLVGYSPWGHKGADTTEWLSTHTQSNHMAQLRIKGLGLYMGKVTMQEQWVHCAWIRNSQKKPAFPVDVMGKAVTCSSALV